MLRSDAAPIVSNNRILFPRFMDPESTNSSAPDQHRTADKLQERVEALNEKAGDLAETLKQIDERLLEAVSQRPVEPPED